MCSSPLALFLAQSPLAMVELQEDNCKSHGIKDAVGGGCRRPQLKRAHSSDAGTCRWESDQSSTTTPLSPGRGQRKVLPSKSWPPQRQISRAEEDDKVVEKEADDKAHSCSHPKAMPSLIELDSAKQRSSKSKKKQSSKKVPSNPLLEPENKQIPPTVTKKSMSISSTSKKSRIGVLAKRIVDQNRQSLESKNRKRSSLPSTTKTIDLQMAPCRLERSYTR